MTDVHTVKDIIDSSSLGRTLVHEHIFVVSEEMRQNYDTTWDEDEKIADAVTKLNDLKAAGIDTIFDPTVVGLGRYIPRVQKVAEQTDLNIVVATGLYTFNDLPHRFDHHGPGLLIDEPEPLVDLFVADIENGIADTGVKAAFLKCVIEEPGLTTGVERTMRAVGQASAQTHAPITVHTNPSTGSGLVAQRVLKEEGADLTKVVIGHSGDSTDLDYLMTIADNGSFLGMDRFGLDAYLPTEQRVDTVVELVRRGYIDKITLAHDASCYIDYFTEEEKKAAQPNWHFRHIPDSVIPMLLDKGLTEDDIDTMLVKNPRQYFE